MNFDVLNGRPIRIMWSQRDPSAPQHQGIQDDWNPAPDMPRHSNEALRTFIQSDLNQSMMTMAMAIADPDQTNMSIQGNSHCSQQTRGRGVGSSEIRRAWGMEISNRSNNNLTPNLLGPEVPPTGNSEFGKAWAEIGIGSENRIPALPVSGSRAPFHQDTDTDVEQFDRNYKTLKRVGKGAFGKAYKVRHKITGNVLMLKKIEIIDLPRQEKEIEVHSSSFNKKRTRTNLV